MALLHLVVSAHLQALADKLKALAKIVGHLIGGKRGEGAMTDVVLDAEARTQVVTALGRLLLVVGTALVEFEIAHRSVGHGIGDIGAFDVGRAFILPEIAVFPFAQTIYRCKTRILITLAEGEGKPSGTPLSGDIGKQTVLCAPEGLIDIEAGDAVSRVIVLVLRDDFLGVLVTDEIVASADFQP